MATYHLRALARDDLEVIWDYTIEQWGIEQAENYLALLLACFEELAKNPEMGRQRDEILPCLRSFPQGRHVIFYEIGSSAIEVIGIVHQSADVNPHLDP
mgnify:CR=1 FL=1